MIAARVLISHFNFYQKLGSSGDFARVRLAWFSSSEGTSRISGPSANGRLPV